MTSPAGPRSAPEVPLPAAPGESTSRQQVLESDTLFRGRPEIVIRHNGREYRLRQTRLGKLILTA